VISEIDSDQEYKVFPATGMVVGFQYCGRLSSVNSGKSQGISDSFKIFHGSAGTRSVLVYFTELGFSHFSKPPAHELFNLSLSLYELFDKEQLTETEERLAAAQTDADRIKLVECFLETQLKDLKQDKQIIEAVRLIYQHNGHLRMRELSQQLCLSQSPFEKRFRKLVGTSPRKFASIVRFNRVLESLKEPKSLIEICYENKFFDQAHFIKDFKQFTGETPETFRRRSE
jgi:AraC-like DNA-binding protein